MIKLLLPFVLIISSVALGRAEVLIYKETLTTRFTGDGMETAIATSGYLIFDTISREFFAVRFGRLGSFKYYFAPTQPSLFVVNTIQGRRGASYTVIGGTTSFIDLDGPFDGATFGKGRNVPLVVGGVAPVFFPRSFKVVTRTLSADEGSYVFVEGTATLALSLPDTKRSNQEEESASAALDRLEARLVSQGYELLP